MATTASAASAVADDVNPFESAAERRQVAQLALAVAAGGADADEFAPDADERALLADHHSSRSPSGSNAPSGCPTPSRRDPEEILDSDDDDDGDRPRAVPSPRAIIAAGPPRLPSSMSRFAHAVPDLSSYGSESVEAPLPAIELPPSPRVWRSRGERLARTLFGCTCRIDCEINDEVRLTVWLLALVAGLICLGFFIAETHLHLVSSSDLAMQKRALAIAIGGCFALVACVLTAVQIRDHLQHWVHPPSQRCVVRILLMVPVYSCSAWFSLLLPRYSLYVDFVRACYEAFVIYTFMILLTKYLGGNSGVVECMQYKKTVKWPEPLCCLPPVKPTSSFLSYLQYGALQYSVLVPVVSLIAVVLNAFGLYGDGLVRADRGYVYVAVLTNLSQLLALYTLVWLYGALRNELQPFKPLSKFLVVKAVVFFTFWQALAIAWAAHVGIIQPIEGLELGEVETGLQDFLVCIEMFIAACLHKYTFGYETYKNGTIKLLMDQRAFFLAQKSYQRAVAQARYLENAARIEAGLPPLPVEGGAVVAAVLPAGTDVLGASDVALAAARADAPAPIGAAAEVDVKLVRVRSGGDGGGDGSSSSMSTEISLQPASVGASELARAGYHADSDDEGDALFDFDPDSGTGGGGMGFEARAASAAEHQLQRPPPPAMQRARSSIQLSVEMAPNRRRARPGSFGGHVDDGGIVGGVGGIQSHVVRGARLPRVSSLSSLRQSAPSHRPGLSFSPSPSPHPASQPHLRAAGGVAAASASGVGASSLVAPSPSHLLDVSDSDPYPSESDFHDSDIGDTGGSLNRYRYR